MSIKISAVNEQLIVLTLVRTLLCSVLFLSCPHNLTKTLVFLLSFYLFSYLFIYFQKYVCSETSSECDYADWERSHGYQMSDVRYAFSDPCGMAMIIMVIIQHLNSSLSPCITAKHICPGTRCWCLFCHHILQHLSQGYRRRQGKQRRSARSAIQLWKIWWRGERVAVRCTRSQFPLLSLCSYPWLL